MGRRREERHRPAALRLWHLRVMLRKRNHRRHAGRIVHRAFEERVRVGHHGDVLVGRARQHTPDVGRLQPGSRFHRQAEAQRGRLLALDHPADRAAVLVAEHEDRHFRRRVRAAGLRFVQHVAGKADDDQHGSGARLIGASHCAQCQGSVSAAARIGKTIQNDSLARDVAVGKVGGRSHAEPYRLEAERSRWLAPS